MIYILVAIAVIVAIFVTIKFVFPVFARIDYDAVAAELDREGAHEMLEKYLRQIAMSTVLPGHFHAGDRDVDAAIAAMTRIFAIEGETRDRDDVRAFVLKLAKDKADAMVKDADKYPIVFDDLWSL